MDRTTDYAELITILEKLESEDITALLELARRLAETEEEK